jgi:hypothetical protein
LRLLLLTIPSAFQFILQTQKEIIMDNIRPSYNQRDSQLFRYGQYPSAAGTTYSAAFDLGSIGERGVRIDPFELLVFAPPQPAANLPASNTLTYSLQFSDEETFATGVIEWSAGTAWSQTGSAAGAEIFDKRFRPSTDAPRYVRVKCVLAGSTANLTGLEYGFTIVS